jgi:hypothetical protein
VPRPWKGETTLHSCHDSIGMCLRYLSRAVAPQDNLFEVFLFYELTSQVVGARIRDLELVMELWRGSSIDNNKPIMITRNTAVQVAEIVRHE